MNLQATLKNLYPQGSWQGQCYTFLHKLVDFPSVGNTLGLKLRACLTFGIPIAKVDSIKVGDIILTNESFFFGHGAFINAIVKGQLQLTESNYALNGRVNHTRLLSPHSGSILGVFRANTGVIGNWLFAWPVVNYPIQLKVQILMNNTGFWNSLLQHMANLQNWFWQASSQKIELIIDYKQTNLTDWPVEYIGSDFGDIKAAIIKRDWLRDSVAPLALDADFVLFVMPRKDWQGTIFDHPEYAEAGMAFTPVTTKPYMAMIVQDEHDDYPPYYPKLGAMAKLMAHELSHLLYSIACSNKFPAGSDLTHNHFYGQQGYVMKPEDIFSDFDYSKL